MEMLDSVNRSDSPHAQGGKTIFPCVPLGQKEWISWIVRKTSYIQTKTEHFLLKSSKSDFNIFGQKTVW